MPRRIDRSSPILSPISAALAGDDERQTASGMRPMHGFERRPAHRAALAKLDPHAPAAVDERALGIDASLCRLSAGGIRRAFPASGLFAVLTSAAEPRDTQKLPSGRGC